MKNLENAVAKHYGVEKLLPRILAGLEAAGADLNNLKPEDLSPVDEFHIGGREATAYSLERMPLTADQHVLDVGCGIGGAVRYIATSVGCTVTGIDLTPEYIVAARELASRTGLGGKVAFEVASALEMPFGDESFDAAITVHVAMNIQDRPALYREIARVLKPGAAFCAYDVMKKGGEPLVFPVPWAETAETSHLTQPEEMGSLLEQAGFIVTEVDDRTEFGLNFFKKALANAGDGPPPLGLHLLMGDSAREKFTNMLNNLEAGRIAPVQILAKRK